MCSVPSALYGSTCWLRCLAVVETAIYVYHFRATTLNQTWLSLNWIVVCDVFSLCAKWYHLPFWHYLLTPHITQRQNKAQTTGPLIHLLACVLTLPCLLPSLPQPTPSFPSIPQQRACVQISRSFFKPYLVTLIFPDMSDPKTPTKCKVLKQVQ